MTSARSADHPVYLDHAATTPMVPAAVRAMTDVFTTVGNASSLHGSGRAAPPSHRGGPRVHRRRPRRPAVRGDLHLRRHRERQPRGQGHLLGPARRRPAAARRILASAVEHHAVLDAVEWLAEHEGAQVTWLRRRRATAGCTRTRCATIADHPDDVALVTVMWANNEVGTVMPIRELAASPPSTASRCTPTPCRPSASSPSTSPPAAVDALTRHRPQDRRPDGRRRAAAGRGTSPCVPLLHGGGQERDVRSGTLDVAGDRRARHRGGAARRDRRAATPRAADRPARRA